MVLKMSVGVSGFLCLIVIAYRSRPIEQLTEAKTPRHPRNESALLFLVSKILQKEGVSPCQSFVINSSIIVV